VGTCSLESLELGMAVKIVYSDLILMWSFFCIFCALHIMLKTGKHIR